MEPIIVCPNCGTEYPRRRLQCPSCDYIAIPKLYRYVPYNDNSLSMLINKEIWCPKAKTLIDPFEFQFNLTKTSLNGIPIDQDSLEEAKNQVRELGVVCLSEVNDNILMWSHYTQGHTGFCIEFERTKGNDLGNWDFCLPVVYHNELPAFSPQELIEPQALTKIAATKAFDWHYEKEWRLITKIGGKLIPLPANITTVIFGCQMERGRRRTVANILGSDMIYKEAIKLAAKFSLEIRQIKFESIQGKI